MKYKVGDKVVVKVELQKSGTKRVLIREPLPDSKIVEKAFPIVMLHQMEQSYTIIIDDDMLGWQISEFHVKHNKVDKSLIGKKFYDVVDDWIVKKKS
jgi:ribosomal protein S19